MVTVIMRQCRDAILAAAAESPDREICGLLFGEAGRIDEVRPAANVAADPRRAFEIDPVTLIAAHRAERYGGAKIVGHYHSHPGEDAMPSSRDVAAAESGSLWLIVAGGELRAWRMAAAAFVAEALTIA